LICLDSINDDPPGRIFSLKELSNAVIVSNISIINNRKVIVFLPIKTSVPFAVHAFALTYAKLELVIAYKVRAIFPLIAIKIMDLWQ